MAIVKLPNAYNPNFGSPLVGPNDSVEINWSDSRTQGLKAYVRLDRELVAQKNIKNQLVEYGNEGKLYGYDVGTQIVYQSPVLLDSMTIIGSATSKNWDMSGFSLIYRTRAATTNLSFLRSTPSRTLDSSIRTTAFQFGVFDSVLENAPIDIVQKGDTNAVQGFSPTIGRRETGTPLDPWDNFVMLGGGSELYLPYVMLFDRNLEWEVIDDLRASPYSILKARGKIFGFGLDFATITGSGAPVNQDDTAVGVGTVTSLGSGAPVNQDDTAVGIGTITFPGSGAPVNQDDFSTASGTITITGTGSPVNRDDFSSVDIPNRYVVTEGLFFTTTLVNDIYNVSLLS